MTDHEICRSYRGARDKVQQIQVLADLNDVDRLKIIGVLTRGGEHLPRGTVNKLYRRLDALEAQMKERELEYKAIVAALKGEK